MNANGIEETDPLYARCMALRADVGAALSAPGPLAAMLQRCAEALARDLEAPGAWIWTLHPESAVLELQAIAGTEANRGSAAERVPVGAGAIGGVAAERQPRVTEDVPPDLRLGDPQWDGREENVTF